VSSSSSSVARSNKRERCPYGASCYRTNPIHRQQAIHPGDSDWNTDDEDEEENTKPVCAYGDECYRTNPDHFNEYDHPKKRSEEMNKKHKSNIYL
jgi:aprataxin and PNK-like factor